MMLITTEHDVQTLVIEWAELHEYEYPELRWLYSSLNGIFIPGPRKMVYRIINRMKSEGMKKGILDLCLPVARHNYHGLYIDIKRDARSEIQPEQTEFMDFLTEQGYFGAVCIGYEETTETLEWYLKGITA